MRVVKEIPFKGICILCLVIFFQSSLCNFGRGHYWKYICDFFFEFRPVVQEKMSFKDFSTLSCGDHFAQQSRTTIFFNFGRGQYGEHSC